MEFTSIGHGLVSVYYIFTIVQQKIQLLNSKAKCKNVQSCLNILKTWLSRKFCLKFTEDNVRDFLSSKSMAIEVEYRSKWLCSRKMMSHRKIFANIKSYDNLYTQTATLNVKLTFVVAWVEMPDIRNVTEIKQNYNFLTFTTGLSFYFIKSPCSAFKIVSLNFIIYWRPKNFHN